jgi:hypothetical protein
MRSPKKTRDALPLTEEGTTATQQLPSCCQTYFCYQRPPIAAVGGSVRGWGVGWGGWCAVFPLWQLGTGEAQRGKPRGARTRGRGPEGQDAPPVSCGLASSSKYRLRELWNYLLVGLGNLSGLPRNRKQVMGPSSTRVSSSYYTMSTYAQQLSTRRPTDHDNKTWKHPGEFGRVQAWLAKSS